MKVWKIALLAIGLALLLIIAIPVTVAAVTQTEALAGLAEFYAFLLGLAQKGLEGYMQFLEVKWKIVLLAIGLALLLIIAIPVTVAAITKGLRVTCNQ